MKPIQSTNAGNFDTFTLFPRLPPELRLKIWKIAASSPRAFTIRSNNLDIFYTIKSRQKHSSLMRVNHEARKAQAAMLKSRKLSFALPGKRPINFNPKRDIIFLQNLDFATLSIVQRLPKYSSFRDGLKFVENLAFCGRTHLQYSAYGFEFFFKLFSNLKSLVVYRCESIKDQQEMMKQRKGSLEHWMEKRGAHYLIEARLQTCWEALKSADPSFQAPAVTFMELGDIEALKSSPENWPMLR